MKRYTAQRRRRGTRKQGWGLDYSGRRSVATTKITPLWSDRKGAPR